ncbi:hypothetical protein [Sporomusa sp. KB1]|jgi:hypothetical protein|uniref:hypothetical protein n=1 Tax=Sporomusa sp. KB1 TaxID=943346 RepID=UPI0011A99FF9|nr:hypothetical protein [Sporomusa sp. KB1]TWH48912.1 hypothetical protein Salpa_5104 [Sporomusa sp. KB1]
MTTCPICGQRDIGKVGADQYYCGDCCVEFMIRNQDLKIYNVEADGTLTLYDATAQGTVNLEVQKG